MKSCKKRIRYKWHTILVHRQPERLALFLVAALAFFAASSATFFATLALTRFSRFGPPLVSIPSLAAAAFGSSSTPCALWFADQPLRFCNGWSSKVSAAFLLEPDIIPLAFSMPVADGKIMASLSLASHSIPALLMGRVGIDAPNVCNA